MTLEVPVPALHVSGVRPDPPNHQTARLRGEFFHAIPLEVRKGHEEYSWKVDHCFSRDMGVSRNRGTPKWMVSNGKPY